MISSDLKRRLINARLESCKFSRSSVSLQFDHGADGAIETFTLSTSDELDTLEDNIFKADEKPREEYIDVSEKIWSYLESTLVDITLSEDERLCTLRFDNNTHLYIWRKEIYDNLIIVTERNSKKWYTIG